MKHSEQLPTNQKLIAHFKRGDVVRWNALALHGSDRDGWVVQGLDETEGLFPIYRVRKGKQTGSAVQTELESIVPAPAAPKDQISEAAEIANSFIQYAYDQGMHEIGIDPVKVLMDEITRLREYEWKYKELCK